MKTKSLICTLLMSIVIYSCTSSGKETGHTGIINLPESLDHIEMIPLSDIASSIEYIPLEDTSEEALVGAIQSIHYDDGHFFIKDNTGLIKIFDRKGAFVRTINRIGRGPQEYAQGSFLSISPSNGNLLLTYFSVFMEYNQFGDFIRKVEAPQVEGYLTTDPIMISENRFIASLSGGQYDRDYCAVIYDSLSNILQLIPTPELYGIEQQESINQNSGEVVQFVSLTETKLFRYEDQIRIFYPETKEIFTTKESSVLDTAYVIDYGRYRLPGGKINESTRQGKYLMLTRFIESEHYLFMNMIIRNILDDSSIIMGNVVFNKRTMESRLLHNRSTKMNGFIDDILGGPAFWPRTVAEKNKLVSFAYPTDLIEHSIQNGELKNTLSSLTDDSNPVVILVHLK